VRQPSILDGLSNQSICRGGSTSSSVDGWIWWQYYLYNKYGLKKRREKDTGLSDRRNFSLMSTQYSTNDLPARPYYSSAVGASVTSFLVRGCFSHMAKYLPSRPKSSLCVPSSTTFPWWIHPSSSQPFWSIRSFRRLRLTERRWRRGIKKNFLVVSIIRRGENGEIKNSKYMSQIDKEKGWIERSWCLVVEMLKLGCKAEENTFNVETGLANWDGAGDLMDWPRTWTTFFWWSNSPCFFHGEFARSLVVSWS